MGKIKRQKIIVDTNVLVSGLLFGGVPGELIPLWKSRRIHPQASREIIEEYLRVLSYPKFRLSESEIKYLLDQEILPWFELLAVDPGPNHIREDPSDNKFLWCAEAGRTDVIISGDEHLLAYSGFDIPVMTPARFLKTVEKGCPLKNK